MTLVIDKPILDLLGVNPETPFEITTDGQALALTPARDPKRGKAFRAALDKANRQYSEGLKRLA